MNNTFSLLHLCVKKIEEWETSFVSFSTIKKKKIKKNIILPHIRIGLVRGEILFTHQLIFFGFFSKVLFRCWGDELTPNKTILSLIIFSFISFIAFLWGIEPTDPTLKLFFFHHTKITEEKKTRRSRINSARCMRKINYSLAYWSKIYHVMIGGA